MTSGQHAGDAGGGDHGAAPEAAARIVQQAGDGVRVAAERVGAAAGDVAARIPDAAAATKAAADETSRVLGSYPDERLMLGAAFSLGLGAGMFLVGTNRIMVLLALAPAVAMGITLAGRTADARPVPSGRTGRSG